MHHEVKGRLRVKVLVVDDDSVMRLLVGRAVEALGHSVTLASNGEEALKILEQESFPLVILDWSMPGVSGLDVTRKLRTWNIENQPVVLMITAHDKASDLEVALKAGVDDYISKPIPPAMLEARLAICERRVEMRRELHATTTKLAKLQRKQEMDTLARGLAHNINNIMGPIIAYTQLVQRGEEAGSKNYERLDNVLRSCNQARLLARQVSVFSGIGSSEPTALEPSRIVTEVKKVLAERGIDTAPVRFVVDDGTPSLLARPVELYEAIANLISNGLIASEGSGDSVECHLSLGRTPKTVRITVADQGAGMDDESLRRCFDLFFTTRQQALGNGLGLSVVRGVADAANAELELTSEVGKGTRVTIDWPAS